MVAKLRPETDVPGLYLTGQDILSCGFTGALFAGVVSAQVTFPSLNTRDRNKPFHRQSLGGMFSVILLVFITSWRRLRSR